MIKTMENYKIDISSYQRRYLSDTKVLQSVRVFASFKKISNSAAVPLQSNSEAY